MSDALIGLAEASGIVLVCTSPWWIKRGWRSIPGYMGRGFAVLMIGMGLLMAFYGFTQDKLTLQESLFGLLSTLVGLVLTCFVVRTLFNFMKSPSTSASSAPVGLRFRNPANGYTETISSPGLWTFLFGCFYFGAKGIWVHAAASLVLAVMTAGISWLVYPFFASRFIRQHYLRSGWIELA